MKFKIITLGCKVNTYESEFIKEKLLKEGYKDCSENADIVIINTCSVTNMADVKSRKMIRKERKENKNCILVVCGCSAQNHQDKLKDLDIDILLGNKDKSKIVEFIKEYIKTRKKYCQFYDNKNLEFEDMEIDKFTTHTRGFIKVQDGCNNYCSYCIIPYLRGNIRSKNLNTALKETKTLVANGHQEIVLTGIHTGSYKDENNHDLVDLIEEMSKIKDLRRIRISSIEITELNDKFMRMLKNNPKVCNHLHIPLQSGSDKILKLMHRKYDTAKFLEIVNKIRSIRPDISITTDVIVGFPNETEEDFNDCLNFCQKVNFAKIHVFPYSKREGTVAAAMPGQISNEIKKSRTHRLIELSNQLQKNYNQKFINQTVEVLIEETDDNKAVGHTSNYLKVVIAKPLKNNNFYQVLINDIAIDELYAILPNDNK